MKRSIILLSLLSLLLTGCGLQSNFREVEDLLVIRTMGIDKSDNGLTVTLASAPDGEDGDVRVLRGSGGSISAAMEDISSRSYEQELFCYHVEQVLIGESLAEDGIDDCLRYICTSPDMRLDSPLFIVTGSSAEKLISSVGSRDIGAAQVLDSLVSRLKRESIGEIYSAVDVLSGTDRTGSSLIRAVECTDASEDILSDEASDETSPPMTARAAGYAVIRGGKLCGYLSEEDSVAAALLLGTFRQSSVELPGKGASTVTADILEGTASLSPRWSETGELRSFDVKLSVSASFTDSAQLGEDLLLSRLENELSSRVCSVFSLSRSLHADFLGLAYAAEMDSPRRYNAIRQSIPGILPVLSVQVSVSARLIHQNDMEEL